MRSAERWVTCWFTLWGEGVRDHRVQNIFYSVPNCGENLLCLMGSRIFVNEGRVHVNIPSLGIHEMNNCGGVRLFHLFQDPERLHVDQWTINCLIKMDDAVKFYLKEKYSDSAEVFCFLWAPEIVATVSWKCSMMLYFSQYISNIY